jgi:hypothetical protein
MPRKWDDCDDVRTGEQSLARPRCRPSISKQRMPPSRKRRRSGSWPPGRHSDINSGIQVKTSVL